MKNELFSDESKMNETVGSEFIIFGNKIKVWRKLPLRRQL